MAGVFSGRGPLAGRLDTGESIKAVASYLGHTDPGFTLRTYTHLMPSSEERTRLAIDELFGDEGQPLTPWRRSNG